jgi:hypothetical protein
LYGRGQHTDLEVSVTGPSPEQITAAVKPEKYCGENEHSYARNKKEQ